MPRACSRGPCPLARPAALNECLRASSAAGWTLRAISPSISACRVMLWRSFFSVALTDDGCELFCSPVSLAPPLPPPSYRIFSRVFTWGDPKEGKLGCTSAAVTSPRLSTVSSAAAAESAVQSSDTPGNDSSSSPSPKACFSLPQEVMLVLTPAVQCPLDFVAFQLPEFGPSVDQMFVVEVACGSR